MPLGMRDTPLAHNKDGGPSLPSQPFPTRCEGGSSAGGFRAGCPHGVAASEAVWGSKSGGARRDAEERGGDLGGGGGREVGAACGARGR